MRCLTTLGLRKVQFTVVGQFQVARVRATLAAECGRIIDDWSERGLPPSAGIGQTNISSRWSGSVSVAGAQPPQCSLSTLSFFAPLSFKPPFRQLKARLLMLKTQTHPAMQKVPVFFVNHQYSLKKNKKKHRNPKWQLNSFRSRRLEISFTLPTSWDPYLLTCANANLT